MVNHWLFQIMSSRYAAMWDTLLRYEIAAQHYPPGWKNEGQNLARFTQIKEGDKIVAAFTRHRFAGYGTLKSRFYRGGPIFSIKNGKGERHGFKERFDCEWTAIPFDRNPPVINCHELKEEGYDIDMQRGFSVSQISQKTFAILKEKLDDAGARQHRNVWVVKTRETLTDDSPGWHWRSYFDGSEDGQPWGGPEWIKSHYSRQLLQFCVRPSDIILCYQMDDPIHKRAVLGLTKMDSKGLQDPPGSGNYNCFKITDADEAFVLETPLHIDTLHKTGFHPACFARGTQGTLFPISGAETRGIINALVANSPDEREQIIDWLLDAKFETNSYSPGPYVPANQDDEWDRNATPENIEVLLDRLDQEYATKGNYYVKRLVQRWSRNDRPLIRALKDKYGHRCQYQGCKVEIPTRNGGFYCEVAHIIGVAEGGPARRINLVVLCPNHHKMFDCGYLEIKKNTDTVIEGLLNGKPFTIRR